MMKAEYLFRIFQRALLFNVPKVVDFISFKQNLNIIELIIISRIELNESEKDDIYSAASEAECEFLDNMECIVHFIVLDRLPDDLQQFGNVLLAFSEPK